MQDIHDMCGRMLSRFQELFGTDGGTPALFRSPGRVNLIGEHTDYNGGHVFPCAISLGIWALAAPRQGTDRVRLHSMNFEADGTTEAPARGLEYREERGWANYPLGVLRVLEEAGHPLPAGLDLLFWGDLPGGAGLSSSASIEVLTARVADGLFGMGLQGVETALLAQRAENDFVGMKCGIMDQFAVTMGRRNCAVFLDCGTLDFKLVPLNLDGFRIVIGNTNKPHVLAGSEYNLRRAQCEGALEDLRRVRPVKALGDLTEPGFKYLSGIIRNPVNLRRARHAVTENQRTLRAVAALEVSNLAAFGQLMNQSHVSLRDDYEVSCPELDALVELAWRQPGVVGSRMTGGGFGGCTVSIVEAPSVEAFVRDVGAGYTKATGLRADFYEVDAADGAGRMERP